MKFIDEVDIELVNQELNFHSQDNNLVIKGGCDLFTTKPIGSDRKLFKTIDKHLDQILEDNQLSRSMERDRQNSMISLLGSSSASPPALNNSLSQRRGSQFERERRGSNTLVHFNRTSFGASTAKDSLLLKSLNEGIPQDYDNLDESPFGPLKNVTTRKTFAYLIAILNTSYPDHDFSNLQPTTENFHRILSAEDLIGRFNNIMISLGKKEHLLNWIWDTVNVYMDIIPSKASSPQLMAQNGNGSRHNSFNGGNSRHNSISGNTSPPQHNTAFDNCQIYQFQPSDESILEDLNYPYQTMWSYYWFIYNRKKKRVSFMYLTAINKIHYSMVNSNQINNDSRSINNNINEGNNGDNNDGDDDVYLDEYMDEDVIIDDDEDDNNDIVGDLEI